MSSIPQQHRFDPDEVVLGVDTHKDVHVAAALTTLGVLLATSSFPFVTVAQDVLQGADGVHTYYPVVAADAAGDALLGFNQSSTAEYVSLYYAGQLASDPRNVPLTSLPLK